jgi:hypothetical protein
VRRSVRLALVVGFLMSAFAAPAQANVGPCSALGDVCYEVLHRPLCIGLHIC